MYQRILKNTINDRFFKGKAIIVVGARQVGKTTLIQQVLSERTEAVRVFTCDDPTDRDLLTNRNLEFLITLVENETIIFIDEAQKVPTIGQTLKLLVDHYKHTKQIIVTGSSSIHLLRHTEEALTGRKFLYTLYPISLEELYAQDRVAYSKGLEQLLLFGSYPEIVQQKSIRDKTERLLNLTSSYLYKDILELYQVRRPALLTNLLKALALQIGQEVSINELSSLLGVNQNTVNRYIDLLEQNFIILRLPSYITNRRREMSKQKKIFFYDLGVRNAIINNFNLLENRNDVGQLWENFVITERLKYQTYHQIYSNNYFWRTYDGSEVDLVEERAGKLFGYECKWNVKKHNLKAPKSWSTIPHSSYTVITPEKIDGFII